MRHSISCLALLGSSVALLGQGSLTVKTDGGQPQSFAIWGGSSQVGTGGITQTNGTPIINIGPQSGDSRFNIMGADLTSDIGNRSNLLSATTNMGGVRILQRRFPLPAGWPAEWAGSWYNAATRMASIVGGSTQGYIEFNPPGQPNAVALGSLDSEIMRLTENGRVGIGTGNPFARFTIASPAPDGAGSWQNGLLFTDTTTPGMEWTHAAIYSDGSAGYNGSLVFATDGGNDQNEQLSEKMRLTYDGKLGIRTKLPGYPLEVNGSIAMSAGSGGGIVFPDGSIQSSANTFKPVNGIVQFSNPTGDAGFQFNTNLNNQVIAGSFGGGGGNLTLQANDQTLGADTGGILMLNGSHRGDNLNRVNLSAGMNLPNMGITIDAQNRVGIGVTGTSASLSQSLEVVGNVKISGQGASMLFPDGTVQATAWNGTLCGGDYAESIDVTGERQAYEAGDLLMIDVKHPGHFQKVSKPYSTLVAGVYATKPGLVGRRQPATKPKDDEVPMAMVGIVPTKVTDENGSIEPGDLLVASSTPGYAMKGTERDRLTGAVVGKALAPSSSSKDLIEVLITLQ